MGNTTCDPCRELRITNVRSGISNDLQNIADHIGIPVAAFIKSKLDEIINSYPEHLIKEIPCEQAYYELRVSGIKKETKEKLQVIAKNTGIPLVDLIKSQLIEICKPYPSHMKTAMVK